MRKWVKEHGRSSTIVTGESGFLERPRIRRTDNVRINERVGAINVNTNVFSGTHGYVCSKDHLTRICVGVERTWHGDAGDDALAGAQVCLATITTQMALALAR